MTVLSLPFAGLVAAAALAVSAAPRRARGAVLLLASAVFYAGTAPAGALWLAAATAGTFAVGARLPRLPPARARRALGLSIGAILGALVLVKLPSPAGGPTWLAAPLGISYFSFRLVSYLLDVAWGRCAPAASAAEFAAYVTYFPHLSSGPIQRWDAFRDDVAAPAPPAYDALAAGLRLVLLGLVKKVVVANRLAEFVDPVFAEPGRHSAAALLVAAYAFPLQLYADFSGLTDLARGVGRLLGSSGPENFDRPFAARSVQEFWSRWHMSLTGWLRDYLFAPVNLALRDHGRLGVVAAVTVNMVAVGLWHGFRWTFLVFGALNALYVVVATLRRLARPKGRGRPSASRWAVARDVAITFHLMVLAFVFFRADSLGAALELLRGLVPLRPEALERSGLSNLGGLATTLAGLAAVEVVAAGSRRGWWSRVAGPGRGPTALRWAAYYAAVAALAALGSWGARDFIYAQF